MFPLACQPFGGVSSQVGACGRTNIRDSKRAKKVELDTWIKAINRRSRGIPRTDAIGGDCVQQPLFFVSCPVFCVNGEFHRFNHAVWMVVLMWLHFCPHAEAIDAEIEVRTLRAFQSHHAG